MVAEFCSFFFAIFGVCLAVLIYELNLITDKPLGLVKEAARIYEIICTVCLLLSIYIRYDLWL